MYKIQLLFILILSILSLKTSASSENNTNFCERDCSMEYKFFKKYAKNGSSLANFSLAIMNYKGHGRESDIELGNKQLLRAAKKNEPAAMYQLAYNLLYGLYGEQNIEKSYLWFKKAKKSGIVGANHYISVLDIASGRNEDDSKHQMIKLLKEVAATKQDTILSSDSTDPTEHITVIGRFNWSFVLYNAKRQACSSENCEEPSTFSFLPVIRIVNEENLLKKLAAI
jgi:hypothetical protein